MFAMPINIGVPVIIRAERRDTEWQPPQCHETF
jgi:hypothetical protein